MNTAPQSTPKTILCIPGHWQNWDEFSQSLTETSEDSWLASGESLIDQQSKKQYTLEWCERDDRMQRSFAVTGVTTQISEEVLDDIGKHRFIIYLSAETGSLEDAARLAYAGGAILDAGGIACKIESAGKSFSKAAWLDHLEDFGPANCYELFVQDAIGTQDGTVYSCGMHNLGLKDTIVSGESIENAIGLIRTFGYFQIFDNPVITHNQTIATSHTSPKFLITSEGELRPIYEPGSPLDNPFGFWRLTRITEA